MLRVHVGVQALRCASLVEDLLNRLGRARADFRVLDHDYVAGHDRRRREAGDLVVREVPRHDAHDHAEGNLAHHGGAAALVRDFLVGTELRAVVGVVIENFNDVVDLAVAFFDGLTHLLGDNAGKLVPLVVEKRGDLAQHLCALLEALLAPLLKGVVGGGQRLFELVVGDEVVGLGDFVGLWVLYSVLSRHARHCTTAR